MKPDDARVMACIVRMENGQNYTEYHVGSVTYPSAEAVEAALNTR